MMDIIYNSRTDTQMCALLASHKNTLTHISARGTTHTVPNA